MEKLSSRSDTVRVTITLTRAEYNKVKSFAPRRPCGRVNVSAGVRNVVVLAIASRPRLIQDKEPGQ